MTDKKRNTANSFRSTSHDNKRSKVVKLLLRWVIASTKCERENGKIFHCNDIGQVMSEICGISRKHFFTHKKAFPSSKTGRKSIYFENFEERSLSCWILSFYRRPSPQLRTLGVILAE